MPLSKVLKLMDSSCLRVCLRIVLKWEKNPKWRGRGRRRWGEQTDRPWRGDWWGRPWGGIRCGMGRCAWAGHGCGGSGHRLGRAPVPKEKPTSLAWMGREIDEGGGGGRSEWRLGEMGDGWGRSTGEWGLVIGVVDGYREGERKIYLALYKVRMGEKTLTLIWVGNVLIDELCKSKPITTRGIQGNPNSHVNI